MPSLPITGAPGSSSTVPIPTLTGVGVGTTPNDGTGDTLRVGFGKVNDNLSAVLGALAATAPIAWEVPGVQTVNYTASVGCFCIRMDATGGAKTVTLPAASAVKGHCYEIIKWDSSGNSVSLVPDGTDTLFTTGGTATTSTQYGLIRVRSVGNGWVKV